MMLLDPLLCASSTARIPRLLRSAHRPPLWACYGAGERGPRLTFQEPDLAYLGAAGLAVAERRARFRF
jgi:hypothetical protein